MNLVLKKLKLPIRQFCGEYIMAHDTLPAKLSYWEFEFFDSWPMTHGQHRMDFITGSYQMDHKIWFILICSRVFIFWNLTKIDLTFN